MQLIEEWTAQERGRIYAFLAEVFCSVPEEELVRAVSRMAQALDISFPEDLVPDELHREFMDLFVVPNPRYVAPYESVYRDNWLLPPGSGIDSAQPSIGRLLMGESTLAVRQCFLDAAVLPVQDLPDHFSNELRLMSHLWTQESQNPAGLSSWRELRAKVRAEHLLKWIEPLRQKVVENERLGFYSKALDLVKAMLQDDSQDGTPDGDFNRSATPHGQPASARPSDAVY